MLATGGAKQSPSETNPNIRWIFSTSLRDSQLRAGKPKQLPNDGKLRLVIACRLESRKGTDVLIESLPMILETYPYAHLDIIGGGSLLHALKTRCAELSISDRVTFHEKVPQPEVLRILESCHLFCYPTTASEGFPKVVLEALANGLPVITTRVSVLPELIGSETGILLDEAKPIELSQAVKSIAGRPTDYTRMSQHSLKTAGMYSLENWRDSIGSILRAAWNVESLKEST
jgi:glycosyltransferase involved in cell wall biosynthesis